MLVNGNKVDLPSYLCKPGDEISFREKSKDLAIVKANMNVNSFRVPFVSVDEEKLVGKFDRLPERNEVAQDINEAQIIEYYNRLL